MLNLFKKETISKIAFKLPLKDAIKRAQILVIDDEDSFPVELLRKEGYNIFHWKKVDNLKQLEEGAFDIIFLDIYNVAPKEFSKDDGLGILEHLKKYNPSQIIIAYSGQSFDLSKNRFWKLADDTLAKPSDFIKCKELIDQLLEDFFNIDHYWKSLREMLINNGASNKQVIKLEHQISKSIQSNQPFDVAGFFGGFYKSADLTAKLITIGNTIMKIYGALNV